MDVVQSIKNLLTVDELTKNISLRSAFFAFFVVGDVLQIYIVYRNLRAIKKMDWTEFSKQYQSWTSRSSKIGEEKYENHRTKQHTQTFGRAVSNVVGLCIRCAKFSTDYYNILWRITDGRGLSLVGRACLLAAIDSLSGVVQDALSAMIEVIFDFRSVRWKESAVWLLTVPISATKKAVACYVAIYCLDHPHPRTFLAIWMVMGVSQYLVLWIILRYIETIDRHSPLPRSMDIVTEKTGYPANRILKVKYIEGVTRAHKRHGAKYCDFLVTNYIFVSSGLFEKMEANECAAVVLREAGAWKMWWYTRSHLKLALHLMFHGILGYIVVKSYGNGTLEELFKLEPGMHPIMTEWIVFSTLRRAFSSFYGFIAGSVEAMAELRQDDFVSETLQSNSAFFDALLRQTEIDLQGSSIYDGWYSRRFIGEPTIWERLDRTTKRYSPIRRMITPLKGALKSRTSSSLVRQPTS